MIMNGVTFETVVTVDHQLHCELPAALPVGSTIRVTVEPVTHDPLLDNYQPRTEMGRSLLAARRAYIEKGGKPLTWDEIDQEVRSRRGGVADD